MREEKEESQKKTRQIKLRQLICLVFPESRVTSLRDAKKKYETEKESNSSHFFPETSKRKDGKSEVKAPQVHFPAFRSKSSIFNDRYRKISY